MIVVVGLAFEARIAARSGLPVVCGSNGRNPEVLRSAIGSECRGLISFGVAGGLRHDLRPGTCVVGSSIVTETGQFWTDPFWSETLLRGLPGSIPGVLAGVSSPLATAGGKHEMHRTTGAIAVDMESHVVAAAATTSGLPMAAIRVICDPAARNLPETAIRSVRPDGSTDVAGMLRSLLRKPTDVTALIKIALDARIARASLSRCCRILGPDFGLSTRQ